MSEHTPTPWKWQQEIEGPIDMGPAFIVRRFPIYTANGKFGHPAEAKTGADAEFICQAVNSHAGLLAACEAVLLFYKAGHWSQDEDNRWKELLGVHRERSSHGLETWSFEVTTKRLCDFVREAINKAKATQ